MKSFYLLLGFILLLQSCGMFSSTESGSYVKSKQYENDFQKSLPSNWTEIKSEGSDYAAMNQKTHSILLINSACRKSDLSSLDSLTSSILTGIENLEIKYQKNVMIFEREAIETRAFGKVDGVLSYLNITTVQKNYCIYDFVLIATTEKHLNKDYSTYQELLKGIKLQ